MMIQENFDYVKLQELFIPGVGTVPRSPNRMKKGYLKKSVLTHRWTGTTTAHQGEREKARRRRKMITSQGG